jgi:RNA polymerase-binding transcription factor DksA
MATTKKSAAPKKSGAQTKKASPEKVPSKKASPRKAAASQPAAKKAAPVSTAEAAKKSPAKKVPAKKAPAKKAPAKKVPAQKVPAKKAPAKKAPAKKAPAPKVLVKKAPVKKAPAKKAPAPKAPVKKTPAKKAPGKVDKAGTTTKPPIDTAPPVPPEVKKPASTQRSGPEIFEIPAPRGTSKEGIAYTKDFDVKFLKAQWDLLLEERARLLGQAVRLEDEAHQLIEEAEMGDVQFDDEGGEGDTMVVERERDLALSAQARETITEIDAAIDRIQEGTYGYSTTSGRPIPRERLEAIPWATELVSEKVGGIGRR